MVSPRLGTVFAFWKACSLRLFGQKDCSLRLYCRLFGEQFKDQNCTYHIYLLHVTFTLVTIHCQLIFVIFICHVSFSNDDWLLKVNFDLLTHFASCMLFCILIPQQNHQISCYFYLACCFPSAILLFHPNTTTKLWNQHAKIQIQKTAKDYDKSLQALRLQAPQPGGDDVNNG